MISEPIAVVTTNTHTKSSLRDVCFQESFKLLLMEEILHHLIGSLSHYLQGLIHPRWCRISSINSIEITIWLIQSFKPQKLHVRIMYLIFTPPNTSMAMESAPCSIGNTSSSSHVSFYYYFFSRGVGLKWWNVGQTYFHTNFALALICAGV